jgi:hypothetical protein
MKRWGITARNCPTGAASSFVDVPRFQGAATRIVAVFAVLGLLPPASASAAYLSQPLARRAITTYEQKYWKGHDAAVSIDGCQRRSPVEVGCLAKATFENTIANTRDWVTLLHGGILRVHPGQLELVLVLGD